MNLKHQENKIAIAFGTVLRTVRKKRKLSQEKLASKCEMSRNYIGLLETGERAPSLATMVILSQELQIPFGYLAARFDEELREITKK